MERHEGTAVYQAVYWTGESAAMKAIQFGEWEEALKASEISEREKRSYGITIRWYLSYFSDYRRAKARTNLPVWLTREELQRVFQELAEPWKLMAEMMYGSGLRFMELLRLRVKDLDVLQGIITVRDGKGAKDRYAPFPRSIEERAEHHLRGNARRVVSSLEFGA